MGEAQNFTMAAKNLLDKDFKQTSCTNTWGKVTDNNTITAQKMTIKAFRTSGADSAVAGTQGTAHYETADKTASFDIAWDIPYGLGEDYLVIKNAKGCDVSPDMFSGKQVLRTTAQIVISPTM